MADPLSIAASVIAVLQLAATATDYLRGIKNGADDRVKLRDELRSTTHLLEMLRDRIEDAADAMAALGTSKTLSIQSLTGPENPLALFQRLLEDIVAQLSPQGKLRQRSLALVWPFTKKDIAEKLGCLERVKSHFGLIMQSDLLQLTQSSHRIVQASHERIVGIEQKVDETQARQEEEQKQKVISWLGALLFREQHVAILDSVQPGTGRWFINHDTVRTWLEGKTSMVWCPGLPGAGKTRLMSIVIDTLDHEPTAKNTIHTYIYCNYARREEQTPATLLSSILLQVLQRSDDQALPADVLSLYESHKKYGTRPTSKELTGLLSKLTSPYDTVFIVIDALDECSESDDETIRFVSTVRSIGPNVVLLCSSRFSTTFETYFASTKKVEILARDEDITMFLDSQINQQMRLSKHVRSDPALRQEIIEFITGECQGMFLLAKLHLESLSTKINRKAVRSAVRTLPTTLDDTYSEALQRIHDQPADTAELAELVLLWIVCARQSLTVPQLQHMYATKELEGNMALEDDDLPDGEILTSACGGLINVDTESETIQVIHYTVQQYFERALGPKLMAARLGMTKVCLTYLVLPNFSSGVCTSDGDMSRRLTQWPFLEYAAKHWGSDIKLLEHNEIRPEVERLLADATAVEVASQAWNLSSARNVNWSQEFARKTPALVLAAAFDIPAILRQLVADGNEIEGAGTDKETALIRAAAFGHEENVRVLLNLGADVNAKDYADETALQKASRNGHAGVIEVLLEGGASVNNKASANWTPLMSAVSSGNIDAVRLLIGAGADLKAETVWGDSALSMALRSGQEAIAALLADSGAIMPRGLAGRRAFVLGSRKGLQHLVRRLTVDYEAVAHKTLQRQSSRIMGGLQGVLEETSDANQEPSEPDDQSNDEFSFGEIMEEYDIKTSFNQRYSLGDLIGKGHFASVYRCSDKVTGLVFAVKSFRARETLLSSWRRLATEVRLLRELRRHPHPNLLDLVDVFVDFESYTIRMVMGLALEGELFNLIVAKGKFTEAETRTIFNQLLSAIKFLHDMEWVHRDIKPENILVLGDNLTIKLGDFGLAKPLSTQDGPKLAYTTTLCGTPSYVAPEILQSYERRRYGYGVDIWSSGVVLYVCLCGFPPFSDELYTPETPYTLAQQIKMARYDYPSPYWDAVGDPALDLIDRMLVVDPAKRLSVSGCLSHPWMQEAVEKMDLGKGTPYSEAKSVPHPADSGAYVDSQNADLWASLHAAYETPRTATVELGRSAINYLASKDRCLPLVNSLIEKQADIWAPHILNSRLLDVACFFGHVEVVELLLKRLDDIPDATVQDLKPLHKMFEPNILNDDHKEVIRLILQDSRINIDARDGNHRTALWIAAARGHVEEVQLLIEHGASVNVKDRWASTPLAVAVRNGHEDVVEHFLGLSSVHADLEGKILNHTLAWWAKQIGNARVLQLIHQYAEGNSIKLPEIEEQDKEPDPPVDSGTRGPRWCDICYRHMVPGKFYHCAVCESGGFDVCLDCAEQKFQCRDFAHGWTLVG
ncbi:hypothetical protein BJY00DRAFT_319712 [Aspergillus carlsbadensis]|nr:hypothetical protein BJY00DRAFT_319712 [Aspergillus carlsbadensis]